VWITPCTGGRNQSLRDQREELRGAVRPRVLVPADGQSDQAPLIAFVRAARPAPS
jgi:hypothetical protein